MDMKIYVSKKEMIKNFIKKKKFPNFYNKDKNFSKNLWEHIKSNLCKS